MQVVNLWDIDYSSNCQCTLLKQYMLSQYENKKKYSKAYVGQASEAELKQVDTFKI